MICLLDLYLLRFMLTVPQNGGQTCRLPKISSSAAVLLTSVHVVYATDYATTKKMADKSRRDAAVVFFITFMLNTFVATTSGFVRLEPGKPLVNQVLYHRKTKVYHLVQLQPSRSYELRISYPSTTPTDFYMHMIPQEALFEGKTRKLLNTDKLVFNSDITEHHVNVTAIRTGVPYDTASLAEPVVYNIVLDELLLGIPWHSWRIVVIVLLIFYLTVKYLIPCSLSVIEQSIRVLEKR